jgi:hypothetical protein
VLVGFTHGDAVISRKILPLIRLRVFALIASDGRFLFSEHPKGLTTMYKKELSEHEKAVRAAYHAQFELVRTPLGFQALHKVTGQSYQAHDVAAGPQREAE